MVDVEKKIDYSKLGKYSRRKGKSFQRKIKELISKELNIPMEYLEEPIEWGGQPLGDIIVLGKYYERFPVFIEAKKRENFDLKTIFTNADDNVFVRWWWQTAKQIPDENDKLNLMLVFSKNYFPILFFMPADGFRNIFTSVKFEKMKTLVNVFSEKYNYLFVMGNFKDLLFDLKRSL